MKIIPALILASLFCTSTSYAAGFDCSKAKSPSEKTICGTTSLANLDEILVLSFNKALEASADAKALKTAQLAWLKAREACASKVDCITEAYTTRISELVHLVAKNQQPVASTPANPSAKPVATQATTNNNPAPTPTPKPAGKTLSGSIVSYECGDNCYLTVKDEQGNDHVALCTAPQCDSWNEVAAMPTSFLKKKVQVSVGRAKQYDGAGNEMGEMDAFDKILFLP